MALSAEDRNLNISILKSSLQDEDFGILEGRNQEIDSIESLSNITTPVVPKATTNSVITPQSDIQLGDDTISDDIEEVEGDELPEATPPADTPTTDKTSDLLKVFGSNLAQAGLIDFKEEEFEKAEDKDKFFEDKIADTIKAGIDSGIKAKESEWPEDVAKLIELHKTGVPLHALLEADAQIASLEGITTKEIEGNIDLQKDILREVYSTQGFSKDRVDAKIKRAEDLGTLKDDSTDGLEILLENEKKSKQAMIKTEQEKFTQAEQARQDRLKSIEDSIKSTDEIIPGFKLTEEDKKTLINGITKATTVDKNGKPINALAKARIDDPKMDLKVAYFTLVLKGDLSKLAKTAATKTTRSLKSVLDSQDPIQGSGQSAGVQAPQTSKINKDVLKNSLKALRRLG